ncbi:tannase/feruloyl esterase family alpha/beta hydrolase [Streptacidiphilus jiangxiensis]|uniref:Feruloyl esterase n=1 Tax=Streptacidiphilus jiangxiensis TaxID=235985 RepID=A0A1H7WHC9_STRJI|nr:tannase/feruloyl esterase family alpha/beta hydrolase [Streptacidiphilus jiangxiensis]SEM20515.1 feruloyl esterase [Streptacidiphilus jiangxiensis]
MKRFLTLAAAAVPLTAALVYAPNALATAGASAPSLTCAGPVVKAPAGTRVESVTAVAHAAGTVNVPPVFPLDGYPVPDVPAFCDVTVTLTHAGQGDHAKTQVWLPLQHWNGRLQTVGGSAYAAGDYGGGLAAAVKGGYAAATTDAGVRTYVDTSWALTSSGKVNRTLLTNFASRSEHETAVVAKEVISGFYDRPASYAYFNGCSTGGRQGYAEAQNYPTDYNGILADAPAVNWPRFEVATLWPQVVMNQEKTYPTACEFDAFTNAAIKACDGLDGAEDGLIGNPDACHFDPRRLVGTTIECNGKQVTITAADAAVVRKIWDGPRTASGRKLWPGVPVGADLTGLAGTKTDATTGKTVGFPFPVPAEWVASWVEKKPTFDVSTITYSQFTKLFQQSEAEYDTVIGTDNPNLTAFRNAGGKLLTWHGLADQYIPTDGTVQYREQVERQMGGAKKVNDFYRLFLAPGASHCLLGGGHDLAALTDWVEHGKAPQTLSATVTNTAGRTVGRNLCAFPEVLRYKGHGDLADASSFRCGPASRH